MKNLLGQKVAVFDLECKQCPGQNGIKWTDYELMGVSVGASYFYETDEYKVYMDDNIKELAEDLCRANIVSGFNIVGFDIPLLSGVINEPDLGKKIKTYDLLYWSRRSVGKGYAKGLKLDDHLIATFGKEFVKTAHGSEAPAMYQRGEIGRLTSYCMADVKREKMLLDHAFEHGWVKTNTHGKRNINCNFIRKALENESEIQDRNADIQRRDIWNN